MSRRDVVVDAESFWNDDISIRKMCMKKYMSLSYTYLWSVATEGFSFAGSTQELMENYEAQAVICDANSDPWAVNSNFDFEWFLKNFPHLKTRTWQCVSDYATYHQRPRALANMHRTLTGKDHSKVMRATMKDRHFGEFLQFEQQNVADMNLGDSVVALEDLGQLRRLGPMRQSEREVAAHTRMICRRGMNVDPEYIEKCRQALQWVRHNSKKELPWKDSDTPLAVQAFNTWSCSQGVAPPANLRKDGADFTDWMEANPKLAPVMKARQRYELSNRKLSHIEKFLSRCHDGIYYPDLLYCGAPHTRRWSAKGSSDGSQTDDSTHSGFNIQNMDREPLFGDLLTDFISPLPPKPGQPGIFFRNFLVPRPGKKFVIWDFRQIEPLCLAWLVGDEAFLDLVRKGYSVYEAHARTSLHWTGGDLKTEDNTLYRLAKAGRLGLGYGCGKVKFPSVAWQMARLKLTADESERAVNNFRQTEWRTVGFWRNMQKLCIASSQSKEPLEVVMPNGDVFRYFDVEQYTRYDAEGKSNFAYRANKTMGDPNPKNIGDIYGGRITENVTQRMARDLLAEAILRIEKAGMPVCFHAHDELIAEVDAVDAKDAYTEGTRLMEVVPEWASGLPVGASGGVYDRYTKAD